MKTTDGRWQLRFKRTLAHPQEVVWKAVTEPEHLAAWFPTTIEGERAAGAPLRFSFPGGQAPPFDGEMLAYEPPSVMEIRWGSDIVRIELYPADGAPSSYCSTALRIAARPPATAPDGTRASTPS